MSDRATRALDAPATPAEEHAATPPHPVPGAEPVPGTAPEAKVFDPDATQTAQASTHPLPPPSTEALPAPSAEEVPPSMDPPTTGTAHAVEVEVECPGCGMILVGDQPRPSAEWFCPRCDYPVFWASPPATDGPDTQARARRRLPGTSGRQALGADPCWYCGEMNEKSATACLRCAATLPKPVPPQPEHATVTVEVPVPMPVAYLGRASTGPFIAAATLAGMAIAITGTLWALRAGAWALLLGGAG